MQKSCKNHSTKMMKILKQNTVHYLLLIAFVSILNQTNCFEHDDHTRQNPHHYLTESHTQPHSSHHISGSSSADSLKCPKNWISIGQRCFRIMTSLKSFQSAKSKCEDTTSKIAVIEDESGKEKETSSSDVPSILAYLSTDKSKSELGMKQFYVTLGNDLVQQFQERVNSGFYDETPKSESSTTDHFDSDSLISDLWLPRDDPNVSKNFPNVTDRQQLIKKAAFALAYSRERNKWGLALMKPEAKAQFICERPLVDIASPANNQNQQSPQQQPSNNQQIDPYTRNQNQPANQPSIQNLEPKRSLDGAAAANGRNLASSISYSVTSANSPSPTTISDSIRSTARTELTSVQPETPSHIFREIPHDQSVILGSTVEMRCSPLENESILFWSFNGKNLTQTSRIKIHANGTMRIDHVRNSDDGSYTCTIISNGVSESKSARLDILQRPHPPEYINAELLDSSSSIRVKWTPGFNGNSPIKSYLLEMRTVINDNIENDLNSIMHSNTWENARANISADQTEVIIADLKPARKYIFRIRATNRVGTGDPSMPTKTPVEVPVQPPSQAPERISGTPNSPTSIKIQWSPPPIDAHNGQLKGYTIRHKLAGYASDTDWYTKVVSDAAHLTYILDDLIVWQNYEIQVAAENDKGVGPFSSSIVVRTKEGKPDKAPKAVSAEPLTSTSIKLSWLPPPPQHINGFNLGYKIKIWSDFSQTNLIKEKTVPHNTVSPQHSTIIDELMPYSEYYVTVNCYTIAGDGPSNENIVQVKTKEDLPEEVQSLEFNEVLDKSLKAMWKPPKRINGELNHYTLEYSESANPDKKISKKYPAGTTETRITDLNPQTAYLFKIYCHTLVGQGPAKTASITTSVPPVLPEAPRDLSVVHIGPRSVTIEFEPGFNGNANIDKWIVEGQIISRQDEMGLPQWHTIYISTNHSQSRSLQVNNLSPFTRYRVRLIPINVVGRSHYPSEPTHEFQTAQTEPEQAPKDLILEDIKSSSLVAHWTPLPNHLWLGIPRCYNLTWTETNQSSSSASSQSYPVQFAIINNTRAESYLVKDLEEFTEYSFRIFAVNEVGSSPSSEVVNVLTHEDVPSSGPNNLTARAISSTAISIDWNSVPKRHRKGIIRGYKIQYRASQPPDAQLKNKIITDGSTKHVTLNDLKPYTTYSLAVAAYTSVGDGVFSGVLNVQTHEDTPGSPQNVSSPTVAQTSARILWDPPEETNGEVQGYKVSYYAFSDGGHKESPISQELHANERTFKATNLKPFTNYHFTVAAKTKLGWGQPSDIYLYTHDSELRANLPFYREGWFTIMCASLSIVITIIITALLYIQTKSYKYKQDAIKSTSQDRLGDAGFTIDDDPTNHYNNTGFGLLSQNVNNRRSSATLHQGYSNYTLPKSPPRPHPGSVVYSDGEGDDDVFEEVVGKQPSKSIGGTSTNYDSSDSLAEKPGHHENISSSTAPESESNDDEYANMANNLFANHYANVNGALRAQKAAWQNKKPNGKTYASYRTKPKLPQRPAPSVPQVPNNEPGTSGSSDNPASTLSLPGPSGYVQPIPRGSQPSNTSNGIYESRPPTIIPSSVTNPQINNSMNANNNSIISSTNDGNSQLNQQQQIQQQADLLNNNNHIINLNGGRIIVDNMAGSRAPLPGFTSFV